MENIQILLLFDPNMILKQILLLYSFFIHIAIRNLNFTMEKLRKQHISSFKGR